MHSKLANALGYLDIGEVSLLNEIGEVVCRFGRKEHAEALFTYLELAGYLNAEILEKAVHYLSAARPFACSKEQCFTELNAACSRARQDGAFDTTIFFEHFCNTPYFQVDDIIDLIVFLQQTAFDRNFGVERDQLQTKPWLEQHKELFQHLATKLGIVSQLPPTHTTYCATGITGGASVRVETRIKYFNRLLTDCGPIWAFSGNRELSKGLDSDEVMLAVAEAAGKSVDFVEKGIGAAKRTFLNGITETMMVNCLLEKMCPGKLIALIDSAVEEGHWRATTSQGAKDIASILVQKIKNSELVPDPNGIYRFMIIAEQPYPGRMARQVQRAFDTELKAQGLNSSIKLIVEGVGPGIQESDLLDTGVLTRINSELGALMAERYNDARLHLMENNPSINLRDASILMYSTREKAFITLSEQAFQHIKSPSSSSASAGI